MTSARIPDAPTAQAVGLEQHDATDDGIGQRVADATGMAAHEVVLELADLFERDALVRKRAEAGVHAIGRLARSNDACDRIHAAAHLRVRFWRERDLASPRLEIDEIAQAQVAPVQQQCVAHRDFPPTNTASGARPPSW
jgi:hypothetical protein